MAGPNPASDAAIRAELSRMTRDQLREVAGLHILFFDSVFDDEDSATAVLGFRRRQQMAREMLAEPLPPI
ncbi:hypothetical protein GCM10027034_02760 [Ramlibacter solisilvae]|uniref:hypothetical protein n=1 Tax=Ramlibacter tataouinensis TaxID=94132 RepID=UPI0011AE44DA|nr:hypothetical protein [Ramlibacter tataouinensis]